MGTNTACNCCEMPPPVRVVLQYASFNRSCSNNCYVHWPPSCGSGASARYDFLMGPWLTAATSSGTVTKTLTNVYNEYYTYKADYSRTTSAYIELEATRTNDSPPECLCDHGYDETQSSSWSNTYTSDEGVEVCSMTCTGTAEPQDCEPECPAQGSGRAGRVEQIVSQGGGITGSKTEGCTSGNSVTTPLTQTCQPLVPNCPVPELIGNVNITPTTTYYGDSAACEFTENETPVFPQFGQVTRLVPAPIFNSGYSQVLSQNLPPSQGYQNETFRYARCSGDRCREQSEQHVKFRVIHNPTATCYLKVWFRKKIVTRYRGIDCPDSLIPWHGGPPKITFEDLAYTYEWDGSSNSLNLCIPSDKSIYDLESIIYGGEQVMDLPQPDVSLREYGINESVFIKKMSFIKGYEPPDPPPVYSDVTQEFHQNGFGTDDVSNGASACNSCGSEDWSCPFVWNSADINCP